MYRILIVVAMLAVSVASQPLAAQNRGVHLEVTIGDERVESVDAVFASPGHVPPATLDWVASPSGFSVAVDGDTPMRVVESMREALLEAGVRRVRFESNDRSMDPDARLEATGRISMSFGTPGDSDLLGELEPMIKELLPSATVLLQISDSAPARLFMGVQETLLKMGARYIRM